jgi:hypothetical protein
LSENRVRDGPLDAEEDHHHQLEEEGGEDEEEEAGHYYQGDYGLFIPRWANERVSGWLGGGDATLAGLGLRSGDVVECRPRRHRLTLLLPSSSSSASSASSPVLSAAAEAQQPRLLRVTTPAALTIARLLPRLLRVRSVPSAPCRFRSLRSSFFLCVVVMMELAS